MCLVRSCCVGLCACGRKGRETCEHVMKQLASGGVWREDQCFHKARKAKTFIERNSVSMRAVDESAGVKRRGGGERGEGGAKSRECLFQGTRIGLESGCAWHMELCAWLWGRRRSEAKLEQVLMGMQRGKSGERARVSTSICMEGD